MLAATRNQAEQRECEREEVYYRTRAAVAGRGSIPLQVVNISAKGFMARTEADLPVGQIIAIRLPVVGEIKAEVRWALGGRIGCQFGRMIDLVPYLELLGTMVKDARQA